MMPESAMPCGETCMGYVCWLPWNHGGLHESCWGVHSAMGWPDHWSDSYDAWTSIVGVL